MALTCIFSPINHSFLGVETLQLNALSCSTNIGPINSFFYKDPKNNHWQQCLIEFGLKLWKFVVVWFDSGIIYLVDANSGCGPLLENI